MTKIPYGNHGILILFTFIKISNIVLELIFLMPLNLVIRVVKNINFVSVKLKVLTQHAKVVTVPICSYFLYSTVIAYAHDVR